MGIGSRRQIKLIQITPAKGSEGNWSTETQVPFNTWAEISSVIQFREYQHGVTDLGQTKRFKVRFRFDKYPGADWKVEYANKEWTVSSVVKEDEKQFYWIITATAK
jgi:SPP1 family predicted phage head-tail adaptor